MAHPFGFYITSTMKVLGIESSCDETGVALIDSDKGLLAHAIHTQIDMHRAYGGVVPELASRDHIRRAIVLTDKVLVSINIKRGGSVSFGINHMLIPEFVIQCLGHERGHPKVCDTYSLNFIGLTNGRLTV